MTAFPNYSNMQKLRDYSELNNFLVGFIKHIAAVGFGEYFQTF
jgi:hypothetical protein